MDDNLTVEEIREFMGEGNEKWEDKEIISIYNNALVVAREALRVASVVNKKESA